MIKSYRKLTACLIVGSLLMGASVAYAEPPAPSNQPPSGMILIPTHAQRMEMNHCVQMMREKARERAMGMTVAWQLGLDKDKKLTQQDANIIAQAALLMSGHKELAVSKVTPMARGKQMFYRIDVVNRQGGQPVRSLVLNGSNGFIRPLPPQAQINKAPNAPAQPNA